MPKNDTKDKGIREVYNPTDKEKETLSFVYKERYEAMKTSPDRTKAEKDWDKWEKQWETWREARGKGDWHSNHVVPLTLSVVETALSEIVDQTLRPLILPRGSEDIPRARVASHLFDFSWETSDADLAAFDVIKDALMLGTGIVQEYYWQDRRINQDISVLKDDKTKVEETEVLDYDDVYTESVKLQDFFIDEKARSFKGSYAARDCIRRYIMSLSDAQAFFKGKVWDPLDNMKYVRSGGDINYYEYFTPPTGIDQSKDVEVLWYWARKPKDRLVICINDVLVKDGPNPYKHKRLPFARALDIRRTHRFYGKGEAELLESMQDETNTLRRMIIDRNHLDIEKMFFVSQRLNISDEDIIARPHGAIPVDDVNGAKAVEYGDIPRSVELSQQHLEDDATIATGINPRAQALPTAGTATEAAILKESTLKRIRMKMWLLKKELFVDIARLRMSNIVQFYSQPKMEKVIGERGTEAYKQEIAKLQEQGVLTTVSGIDYKKTYRTIPLENKEMIFDGKGQMSEAPSKGTTFFEAKPEYFVPVFGQYNIKYDASSNIQISKALMQTKDLELFDRLFQVASTVPQSYDPVKLGDMLLRSYEKDPNDYKPDEVIKQQMDQRNNMLIEMAQMENKQLMGGSPVPATPYASPAHTRIHLEAMHSEEFQGLPNESPIIVNFTDHATGELIAEMSRSQGSTVNPGNGGQTTQTSASQGITNRPGGMQQPTTKMSEMLPALQTGGNKNLP